MNKWPVVGWTHPRGTTDNRERYMESWLLVILRFCGGFFWLWCMAFGILVPQSGIDSSPWVESAVLTTLKVPMLCLDCWLEGLLLHCRHSHPCIVQGSAVHFSLVTAKLIDAVTPEADLQPHNLLTKHPWVSEKIQNPGLVNCGLPHRAVLTMFSLHILFFFSSYALHFCFDCYFQKPSVYLTYSMTKKTVIDYNRLAEVANRLFSLPPAFLPRLFLPPCLRLCRVRFWIDSAACQNCVWQKNIQTKHPVHFIYFLH